MYKRILLAVDGSDHAMRATDHAIELAKMNDAKVDVITVIDYDQRRNEMVHWKNDDEVNLERESMYEPSVHKLARNGVVHDAFVLYGSPGSTVIAHAEKEGYDLIILGSRGLNAFQKVLLGSVSQKIVAGAKCPVLVIK